MPPVARTSVLPLRALPPAWVFDLFEAANAVREELSGTSGMPLVTRRTAHFMLVSGEVADAAALSAHELTEAVLHVYRSLAREVQRQQTHCVRIWNFVPDIQGHLGEGDRYMTFNAGRFQAFCEWFGGAEAFPSALPTASAVGVTDRALSVHMLAADQPGLPVENPRQTPSYRYSRRYGLRPPCFSRATKLGSTLLIGGTASVLGEHSHHECDLERQVHETCRNIATLIGSATSRSDADSLDALQSLRVHVRDAHHAADVQTLLCRLAPKLPAAELVQAALCRQELLVEIEGVAVC